MSMTFNKAKLDNLAGEIWKSATRLRGKFKAYEYQSVILPIIVIRRLECVLLAWREQKIAEIRSKQPTISDATLNDLVKKLELNPAQSPFSNKTDWTLRKVYEEDHALLEDNFRAYINGFSDNVQDIIDHFNYRAVIGEMVKRNRLAPILNQYKEEKLGPDQLSNLEMGYIYEELLRRFSEEAGEEAGDHFTPREVIRLMVELLEIPIPERHISIYDPACGTGGMLSVAKEHLLDRAVTDDERRRVESLVTVHGQELQPANYAICQADLLLKGDKNAMIRYGNSLIPHDPRSKEAGDQLPEQEYQFDYMLSNPPFGVTWGGKDGYETEAKKLQATRYKAGMPRVNDGALLFLQTILAKMKAPAKGGSRIAIIFNGSPLSNGDCGSGESEIRRWILENDWLDAIVMLPDQLFYNTGIFTYIWLLRTVKPPSHQGQVLLIDARKQFEKEPKAFASKRNRMTDAHRQWIEERYRDGWQPDYDDPHVKRFRTTAFAYHKVSVVFWQTDVNDQPACITEPYTKGLTAANLKKEQEFYASDLTFRVCLKVGDREECATLQLGPNDNAATKVKALLQEADEVLAVEWTHRHYVKDDEYIPFGEDIAAFLRREIGKPIIRWADSPQLGYEILPNKYFYRYEPPTPAQDLLAEFWRLEKDAEKLFEATIQQVITRGISDSATVCPTGNAWIDSIPAGWRLVALKRISEIQTGLTLGKVYQGPLIERPYLRVANVQDGHLDLEEITTIEVPESVAAGVELRPGDVLMTEGGDLDKLGRGYLWNGEIAGCLHQNHIFAVRCFPHKLLPKFLTYITASKYGRDYFEATGKRTTNLASTNATKVGELPIPLPPIAEQAQLVAFLDVRLEQLRNTQRVLEAQIETLVAYRKSLIHECVTGQRQLTAAEVAAIQAHAERVAAWRTGENAYG